MPVQEHRLDSCQGIVSAVDVLPSRLDHTDIFVGKVMNGFVKHIWLRHEVRVQNEEIIALGTLCAFFQCASFEASAVRAVYVLCVKTQLH